MSDVNDRLEKQMEGTNLALAAVAEVLQKMDNRLSKAEEQEYFVEQARMEESEMHKAMEEKTELVKAIATEVLDVMKSAGESKQGMPTDGEGARKAKASVGSSGTVTGGGNDDAKAVTIDGKTETVGQAIQAMQKQLQLIKEGYGMAKDEYPAIEDDDEEGSEEEPAEEKSSRKSTTLIAGIAGVVLIAGAIGFFALYEKDQLEEEQQTATINKTATPETNPETTTKTYATWEEYKAASQAE